MNAYHFGGGKSRWIPYLFLLPGLLLYVIIALGPSLATTYFSFTDATGIRGAPVNWIGLDNYKEFLFLGQASRDNFAALAEVRCFVTDKMTAGRFTNGISQSLLLPFRTGPPDGFPERFADNLVIGDACKIERSLVRLQQNAVRVQQPDKLKR